MKQIMFYQTITDIKVAENLTTLLVRFGFFGGDVTVEKKREGYFFAGYISAYRVTQDFLDALDTVLCAKGYVGIFDTGNAVVINLDCQYDKCFVLEFRTERDAQWFSLTHNQHANNCINAAQFVARCEELGVSLETALAVCGECHRAQYWHNR